MKLPEALQKALHPHVGEIAGGCAPVGGGCIANACRLETKDEPFFLKWGEGEVARTFPAEAEGLGALRAAGSPLVVPEVLAAQDAADGVPGFLLMRWIASGRKGDAFWDTFGRGLAALHRHTAADAGHDAAQPYGFPEDNFIGPSPQPNAWGERWPAFFRARRLEPQVQMARDGGRWQAGWDAPLEALYDALPDLLPARPEASVLHGDLWNGNYMVTAPGEPVLIDPAAYYGHREADLALTELFGGYAERFYAAYREAWPLEGGYDERRAVYNLYHLLNHLNLFGGSYAGRVASALRRFA